MRNFDVWVHTARMTNGLLSATRLEGDQLRFGTQAPVIKSNASCMQHTKSPVSRGVENATVIITCLSRTIEEVVLQVTHDGVQPVVEQASPAALSRAREVRLKRTCATVSF